MNSQAFGYILTDMKNFLKNIFSAACITAVLVSGLLIACSKQQENFTADSADAIASMSPALIGRMDPILIQFKEAPAQIDKIGKAASFTPSLTGEWSVVDATTVRFMPTAPYTPESEISLRLDMGVLKGLSANKEGFMTTFSVAPAALIVTADTPSFSLNSSQLLIEGTVQTDIDCDAETVQKMIQAKLIAKKGTKDIPLSVSGGEDKRRFSFVINNIERLDEDQQMHIEWDGAAIGAKTKSSTSFIIPSKTQFSILSFSVSDDSTAEVCFSDPIDKSQNLNEFIGITSASNFNYRWNIDSNKLIVYVTGISWPDDAVLTIGSGIKSVDDKLLKKEAQFQLGSGWDIPSISFADDGVIIPSSKDALVVVNTKNITGMLIEAFQIYNFNMLQFLQENSFDEHSYLRNVGDPVWKSSIDFEWKPDMKNRVVARGFDIGDLVKKFPDGMFNLRISFAKRHSMYEPKRKAEDFSNLPFPSDDITDNSSYDSSYWKTAGLTYEQRNEFWEQRKNPCHPAFYLYYNDDIVKTKNILVSNLGLMAKKDSKDAYHITVTDLIEGKPVSGAAVKAYSYSQKELAQGKSDSDGNVRLSSEKEIAFITAEKGSDQAWLKVNYGALSISHFQVDGVEAKEGVKGFLYGERGVWRPGDAVHLVFVLQDLQKTLPKDFPVTFTLEDPMGKIIDRQIFTQSVDGFYRIDTKTSASDTTGSWTARIKAGGNTWTKSLKIESIVPNRLFVQLKPRGDYLVSGENHINVTGEWLHGATASNLKTEITGRFVVNPDPFPQFPQYVFTNNERKFGSTNEQLWSGKLDENGTATAILQLHTKQEAPGKLKAIFETRIYEPSGAFSIENKTFDLSPYPQYVGLRIPLDKDNGRDFLLTDKKHSVDFVVVNPEGKSITSASSLDIQMYKLEWRWWWEKDAYSDAGYRSNRSTKLVKSGKVPVQNGKAVWDFEITGDDWGRYLIVAKDAQGHSTSDVIYVDTPWWSSRGGDGSSGASAMLMLSSGKEQYLSNESAEISFTSAEGAQALITVEKNGTVLSQQWMKTVKGSNKFTLPLKKEMAPNVYVHVSLLQAYQQTKNSLPIRLYGIIPIMVENPDTRLSPAIQAAKEFEPNQKASFTISESKGKPMTVTVAVVDEGLLGLTSYRTPNPWNSFYQKEASALKSWDIFSYVSGSFGGKLETLLAIGGGDFIERKGGKDSERFKPVVFFFGPYELKANEKKNIEFDMPQYIGSVRIMAVAGKNGAYGIAENTVKVKSDLMVMPTLPRTLGIGEQIDVPITVFNGTASQKEATVRLNTEGILTLSETKKLSVPSNGNANALFTIKPETSGSITIKAEASASGIAKKAHAQTIIQTLSRGFPYTTQELVSVEPGKTVTVNIDSPGEAGTKKLSAEISQMPALGLERRLSFLLEYPHGCLEQITSRAFPQLYLSSMLQMSQEEIRKTKDNVQSVIDRYPNYQMRSGGFAYWPGGMNESLWATNYAGHFMIEAKRQGYYIDDTIYQPWLEYQIAKAKNWSVGYLQNPADQAYRLYTLALAGKADIGAMNRLKKVKDLSVSAKTMLAAAYALSGQDSAAKTLMREVALEPNSYRNSGGSWDSSTRDTALTVYTLRTVNDNAQALSLVPKLAKICSSNSWLSTQEIAWILISIAPYYSYDKSKQVAYTIKTNGQTVKDSLEAASRLYSLPASDKNTQTLTIQNTGKTILYATISTATSVPPGEEKAAQSGLSLWVSYQNNQKEFVQPHELKNGDRFTVEVRVKNTTAKAVENVALVLPIPTGWEYTNKRLAENTGDDKSSKELNSQSDYQDIRDTHIYTYFDMNPNELKSFTFEGTVTYGGVYYVPAAYAEAMYDPAYRAVVPGEKFSASRAQ